MKKPRARIAMLKPSIQTADLSTAKRLPPAGQENWGRGMGGRRWMALRVRIFTRDKYQCQTCKRAGRLTQAEEIDHIVPRAEGGTDDESNLESICKPCHVVKTAEEAKRGKARHQQ